jgi:hypothetical protein
MATRFEVEKFGATRNIQGFVGGKLKKHADMHDNVFEDLWAKAILGEFWI